MEVFHTLHHRCSWKCPLLFLENPVPLLGSPIRKTIRTRKLDKGEDLGLNRTAEVIINSNVIHLGGAMVAHIHVVMVLPITIMGAGTRIVGIRIGILIEILAGTPTYNPIEFFLLLGAAIYGHLMRLLRSFLLHLCLCDLLAPRWFTLVRLVAFDA